MLKAKKTTPPTPEDYAELQRTDAYFAGLPRELPDGFFDQLQPLARWITGAGSSIKAGDSAAGI